MGLILICIDLLYTDSILIYWFGYGVSLEKVDKFCYLGDMLDADGGCVIQQ